MRRFGEAVEEILSGISDAMGKVDMGQVERLIEALLQAQGEGRKILVVGAGRSSLVGRAFAMRLLHLGFNVFVMGETLNPSVTQGDIALIISGSGSTTLPVTVTGMAKKLRVKVLAVTSNPDSPIGKMADLMVDYFLVRELPWQGEKHAVRYWKSHDPGYLDLFIKCINEKNRNRKVDLYHRVASETMAPVGALWQAGETRLRLGPASEMTSENIEAAQRFWRSILAINDTEEPRLH